MIRIQAELQLIIKGLGEVRRICPWLLLSLQAKALLEAVPPFITIYMSAWIVERIGQGDSLRNLLLLAGLAVLLHFANALLKSGAQSLAAVLQEGFNERYEMRLSSKVMEMDYSCVEDPQTHQKRQKIEEMRFMNGGGLHKLVTVFESLIKNAFTVALSVSLTASLFTMAGGELSSPVLRFVCSPWSSLLLAGGILANVLLCMRWSAASTHKMYQIISDGIIPFNRIYGYYLDHYITSYHAGKDIRIYNQKPLIQSESMALFGDCKKTLGRLSSNQMRYSGKSAVITGAVTGLVYLYVGLKALAGLISVGSIIQYVGSINEFISGFTGFMNQFSLLRANNEALSVYFDFMETRSEMRDGSKSADGGTPAEIELRDVSFQYPGSDQFVLRHINLKLEAGKKLAVVGMNGSGKTTLIKLLCRLYDPTEGEILLDGTDIRAYEFSSYIRLFSVAFQDFQLFSFSLGQNVAAGVEIDCARAESCLQKVGFDARLARMEDGLETCLYRDFDEKGVEISGGEAQKIALARALYLDAPFIFLDEPTAALDPIAEYEIYSRFSQIAGEKTALYISHRLSSCRFCDHIAVFHQGSLVQYGTHAELVGDESGTYYALWKAQAQYYIGDAVKN